ncbi:MAG TPA: MFS transporter [Candidatus Saccharimonadales bacterium]|nr:MFS transporter [Candidatus Saccharimonadales bacterium]
MEKLTAQPPSPWRPLKIPIFRNLLIADFASDVGTFLQGVGAAWLMTSLTSSSVYIALIQTASALPFFLLALPAGSIGDICDRRKLILGTEFWMVGVAIVLAVATITDTMTPWLLLLLTFGLSAGDAIESPSWRAIFPELVPKEDLGPALALNGIEFNLARAVGPGLAGLIIAVAGIGTAFVLNIFSFLGVIWVVARWKRPVRKSRLPVETMAGATRAALRYVRYSPDIVKLLIRAACLIFFASAFWALLPAIARKLTESSLGYGLLLGCFGVGAVIGAIALQRARALFSVETIVSGATAVFAAITWALATLHVLWLLCILSLFGGAAWTVFLSVFNILIQKLAPDWVRARVLAIYLLVFQGSIAFGSALWGVAADHTSASSALMLSSAGIALCLVLPFAARLPEPPGSLDIWNHWGKVSMFEEPEPDEGPVMVTVEYKIDPATESEFLDAMHDYQRIRRRDGATRWGIFYDVEIQGVYVENFLVDSLAEHERQHDRFTVADRECEERVLRFAVQPLKTRHFLYADRIEPQGGEK